jgi:hypothetical protein
MPKIRKLEDLADYAVLAVIAVLGAAMLFGLVTANGALS